MGTMIDRYNGFRDAPKSQADRYDEREERDAPESSMDRYKRRKERPHQSSMDRYNRAQGERRFKSIRDDDGNVIGRGLKDSLRDADGSIIEGDDFRNSAEYKGASRKDKKAYDALLKDGALLTPEEEAALFDETGRLKKDAIKGDESINESINRGNKLNKSEEQAREFNDKQQKREEEFDKGAEDKPEAPSEQDDYSSEVRSSENTAASSGVSGDIKRSDAFAIVDREVQEWRNELEAAYTPSGPAVGH